MSTQPLRFVYVDAAGITTRRELSVWSESDNYIKGLQALDNGRRTFRKDQVVEYLATNDAWDACPHPLPSPGPAFWDKVEKPAARLEIAFTGFAAARRADLEAAATGAGLQVRKDVTQNLSFLCTGPNAGPKKVAKAFQMQIVIMDEEAFAWMLETGEIPT